VRASYLIARTRARYLATQLVTSFVKRRARFSELIGRLWPVRASFDPRSRASAQSIGLELGPDNPPVEARRTAAPRQFAKLKLSRREVRALSRFKQIHGSSD